MKKASQTKSSRRAKSKVATHEVPVVPVAEASEALAESPSSESPSSDDSSESKDGAGAGPPPSGPFPGRTIVCRNPASGELLGEVPALDASEVSVRLQRARRAQQEWQKTSFAERRRVLRRLLDAILDRADELCRLLSAEAGKTLQNAMMGEIFPVCEKLRYTLNHGEDDLRAEKISSGLLLHKTATIEFHPLGVIGVICPWNFPLQNILGPTIPALFSGNAVLCKVSEWSSHSAPRIQALLDEVLTSCGHSPDLVQILTGFGDTGAALVRSGVDKIVFTGSVPNGRRVLEGSVQNLTPVVLELGGKDPLIVCDDADLSQAVAGALAGVFICSGQMCLAAERIYVMDGIYDRFIERVVAEARALRQGDPLAGNGADIDVGAMTMPHQVEIVEQLVADAVRKGAKVLVGGERRPGGNFYKPTVLVEVDHTMDIMREETFGPVMAIMRVRDDEHAIELANDSVFGLGSTVFSKDQARARRLADRLIAGSTCINDYGLAYMVQGLPFGGVRSSGFGRLNGREGLRACCNAKAVVGDRFPIHIPSKIYPVKPGDYEMVRAAVNLIYRPLDLSGIKARAQALVEVVRHSLRKG
jgi:acyl-CoA reductase-like NAD-dependent aldehyde dehydrogenase